MRPARLIVLLALVAALAGCDSDSGPGSGGEGGEPATPQAERPEAPRRQGVRSPEGLVIRDWLQALERSDYPRAAMFFVPGALVDQGVPFRLRSDSAARAFNASLPCRADLAALKSEGSKVLASFRLRAGPGGPCRGIVKVRFSFRGQRFAEFRQLPGDDAQQQEPRPGQEVYRRPAYPGSARPSSMWRRSVSRLSRRS